MNVMRGQRRFAGMGRQILKDVVSKQLDEIKAAGTYKYERTITSPQAGHVSVATTSKPVLNFCANNYLGLANNPEVSKTAADAVLEKGFGMASVRFICGTQDVHIALEEKITSFLGTEATILYPSCFDANAGVFECILTAEDAVISDSLNHASIIDGIRLCKAERHRYAHLDVAELEDILKKTQHKRMRLIATDGVFSMDGDVAPLDKICQLAEQYDALVFVDDCHATGIFGPGGKGTPSYFGVQDKVDILNSTLGKAMGGASGGFSSGVKEVIELQRQKSRPYLFSNTMAPSVAAGAYKAFELLEKDPTILKQLQDNTTLFRTEMKAAGFTITGADSCAIAPVMLYDAKIAAAFAEKMLAQGIYVIAFSYPVVPKEQARIRVQLSAAHTTEDVKVLLDAFKSVKSEMGL